MVHPLYDFESYVNGKTHAFPFLSPMHVLFAPAHTTWEESTLKFLTYWAEMYWLLSDHWRCNPVGRVPVPLQLWHPSPLCRSVLAHTSRLQHNISRSNFVDIWITMNAWFLHELQCKVYEESSSCTNTQCMHGWHEPSDAPFNESILFPHIIFKSRESCV